MDAPQVEDSNMTKWRSVIFLVSLFYLSVNNSPASSAGAAQGSDKSDVQQKVLAFNLEGLSDSGQKKWDVTGKSAESVSETKVKLNDIVAKAYGDKSEATITAKDGLYDKAKNNVTLENDVKATIVSSGGAAGDIVGLQQEAQDAASQKKSQSKKTTITCDGEVEFDYDENCAHFSKNVKVTSEDGDIDADRITINFDPSTRRVREIVAGGNVRIKQGENITYSDTATYLESEHKILLTGKPKIVIEQDGGFTSNLFGEKKNASS
jgi:lipopolysaccharide assembly outer membrane protein LptD (OstA)